MELDSLETTAFFLSLLNMYFETLNFSFLMNGANMRKPDGPVTTTFLKHFIFDGAIILIIKLKFFSGNTDLFFTPKDNTILFTTKRKKKEPQTPLKQQKHPTKLI